MSIDATVTRVLLSPRLVPGDRPSVTAVRDAGGGADSVPVHCTAREGARQDVVMSSLTWRVRNDSHVASCGSLRYARRRRISGSKSGSAATVAGRSSPKERTCTFVPGTASVAGNQAYAIEASML